MKLKLPKGTGVKNLNKALTYGMVSDKYMKTAVDPLGLGLGDKIYGKNQGPDHSAAEAEQQAAIDAQRKAYEEFINGGAPQYSPGEKLDYTNLDSNSLTQLGSSAMGDIKTDPRYSDFEMEALRQLENQSKDGYSARDQADLARIEQNSSRAAKGRNDAIRAEMENRGLGGSGLDFVMQQQAAQAAAEQEALAGLEKNAQMQERKQSATSQLGNLASQFQSRDFEQEAAKAQANDAIDRFNAANSVGQQQANWQQQNAAIQSNWQRGNQVADKNVDAGYGFRKDKLSAQNQNANNAFNWSADKENKAMMKDQQAEDAASGKMGAVLGVAGGVVGGIYGGPAGAQAGAAVGQGVGKGVGKTAYRNGNYAANGGRVDDPFADPFENVIGYDDRPSINAYDKDTIPHNLQKGEIVLPVEAAKSPEKAAEFVAKLPKGPAGSTEARNKPEALPAPVLAAMAKENPTLIEAYKKKMGIADEGIAKAQGIQDMGSYANAAGKLFNDYNNSQKHDLVMQNRMEDLGKAPSIMKADRPEYDGREISALGQQGVDRATKAKADAKQQFEEEMKLDTISKSQDPNSEESKQAREYLKRVAPDAASVPGFERMTAAQVDKVAPGLSHAYEASENRKSHAQDRQESREMRIALANQNKADKADAKKEKDAEKMEQLKVGDLGYARTSEDAKHLKDAVETKASFDSKLDELINLRADKGVEYLDREAVGRAQQLSRELLLDYKNLAKLGVLSQSDEKIINAIVPSDPLGQDFAPGQDPILSGLKKWKGDIQRDYDVKLKNRLRGGGTGSGGGGIVHGSDLPD